MEETSLQKGERVFYKQLTAPDHFVFLRSVLAFLIQVDFL